MWNLDDESLYFKLFSVEIAHAFTWGAGDLEKREVIRGAIAPYFPKKIPLASWWAFRIVARKSGSREWDVENIPKLIVDAFSGWQLARDNSPYRHLELFPDDSADHVGLIEVAGFTADKDSTLIEVFGRLPTDQPASFSPIHPGT